MASRAAHSAFCRSPRRPKSSRKHSGFEVLEHMRDDPRIADVPVVVFTGKELSPKEDARLRVLADLPPENQLVLDKLHRSDDDPVGNTGAGGPRRRAQYFTLISVLERRGMNVPTAGTGHEAIATLENTDLDRAHGHQTAGKARLSGYAGHSAESDDEAATDHRPHGQRHEG